MASRVGVIGPFRWYMLETVESREAPAPLSLQHVLVPLDGSKFSAAALTTALALATEFDAQLVTLAVASDNERDVDRLRRRVVETAGDDALASDVEVVVGDDPAE